MGYSVKLRVTSKYNFNILQYSLTLDLNRCPHSLGYIVTSPHQ